MIMSDHIPIGFFLDHQQKVGATGGTGKRSEFNNNNSSFRFRLNNNRGSSNNNNNNPNSNQMSSVEKVHHGNK